MAEYPRISVVINTYNEEDDLPFVLRSVRPWAQEIVVVDMHSTDRTREIAASYGARVLLHERLGFVEPARAFAIAQATGEWILVLDADEIVPLPLGERLRQIAIHDATDVVIVSRVNYLQGEPIWHSNWSPLVDRHPRFFKRGMLQPQTAIHLPMQSAPGARVHIEPYREGYGLIHFNFLDFADLCEKSNRYTSIAAAQAAARGERMRWWRYFAAPRPFWVRYVRAQGYRDGWRGLMLALFMVYDRLQFYAKLQERQRYGDADAIRQRYRREAERWLAPYDTHEFY